jgi:hypothetical protein
MLIKVNKNYLAKNKKRNLNDQCKKEFLTYNIFRVFFTVAIKLYE